MRGAIAWFNRWFHWIALVGVVIGLALAVRSQWPAITGLDWGGVWRILLLSAVAFAAEPLAQAASFWAILRLLGARAPFGEAMVIWGHSYVLRYAPSGALAVVYRVRKRDRLRATRDQVLAATAYEHLGLLTAGACACLLAFAALGGRPPVLALAVAIPVVVLAVGVRPKFAGRWAQALLRRIGIDAPLLRGRHLTVAVALNLVAWIGTGIGFLLLANGLSDEPSPGLLWAIATYAVGYLVGFIVPFLPGGLGAREATLVAVLAGRYGVGPATGLALALRLAVTLGEVVAVGAILAGDHIARLVGVRHTKRAAKQPASHADERT